MLMFPAPGPVTSKYGPRLVRGVPNFHNGFDQGWLLADRDGSRRLVAPAAGVVDVGFNATAGNYVGVTFRSGWRVRICHLESFAVVDGQTVRQGQLVGVMGSTGLSFGVNAHVELWVNGARRDPLPHFTIPYPGSEFAGDDGTPIVVQEEENVKTVEGFFAVVDGVTSWMWVNWATGRVLAVHTQAEADHIGSYMGSVQILTDSATATAGEKYKTLIHMAQNLLGPVPGAPGEPGVAVDLSPVLTAIEAVPLRTRAEIIRD